MKCIFDKENHQEKRCISSALEKVTRSGGMNLDCSFHVTMFVQIGLTVI
jgi:hypothetical protein